MKNAVSYLWNVTVCLSALGTSSVKFHSIPSAKIPLGKAPGNFFEAVKSPAPGQNFYAKARALGQKSTHPW